MPVNHLGEHLLLAMEGFMLTQLIKDPTRITQSSSSLIDVIFTTSPDKFESCGALPFTGSDHLMIYGVLKERVFYPPQYVSLRSFRRCNTEDLLTDLKEAPWSVMDIYDDIDDKWMYWKGLFLQVVDRHAPVLTFRKKRGSHPWVTGEILQLMQKRNFFRKKFQQTKDQNYWERYKHLRGQVIRTLRAAKTEYFKNVCTDIGKNPRKAWNQLNSLMGKKASKVDTLVKDNLILQDSQSIANAFNSHFASIVESSADEQNLPSCSLPPVDYHFKFTAISEAEVLKILSHLDTSKSTGPDGISAKLLKLAAPSISGSLATLFNHSLMSGRVPSEWKVANITPVPKGGDKQQVNNYRPISVIAVTAKIFERLVHEQLYKYLNSNSLIHQAQSGFRPNHSTQDVLLKSVDDWRRSLDCKKVVGAAMVDLSKAFDTINHNLLLEKLHFYGIPW